MKYDPNVHHRRSVRLPGYDYSQPGGYFVTICTHDRSLLLEAEPVQELIRSVWQALPMRFPRVAVDEFVVMPNHVHGIIVLRGPSSTGGAASGGGAAGSAPTLARVVRAFKSLSAIEANRALGRSNLRFWQRNYHEHIIRDEAELNRIRQYIRDNPLKWAEDPDNPSNL